MLAGFNEQEGYIMVLLPLISNSIRESVANGMSENYVKVTLTSFCGRTTPLSTDLCIKRLMKTYGLEDVTDDKERGIKLSYAVGEFCC